MHILCTYYCRNLEQDMPEGSWKCEKCNNINYPFRTQCNRQNCGADKPSDLLNSSPGASENDQVCCFGVCTLLFSVIRSYNKTIILLNYIGLLLMYWFYSSTVPVSTKHVWEGPEFSSSIAQCGCLKVSHDIFLLQRFV